MLDHINHDLFNTAKTTTLKLKIKKKCNMFRNTKLASKNSTVMEN